MYEAHEGMARKKMLQVASSIILSPPMLTISDNHHSSRSVPCVIGVCMSSTRSS